MKRFRELMNNTKEDLTYLFDEIDRVEDKMSDVRSELKDVICELNETLEDKSLIDLNSLFLKLAKIYEMML